MGETEIATVPLSLFYVYAHEDERLRKKLDTHLSLLKQQGVITTWHDRDITAGAEWANAIDAYLDEARIILLLVSASFLASSYCYSNEMTRALKRHEAGDARVIPIILRAVDWTSAPFSKLQALPTGAKPVTGHEWRNMDEAFTDIAQGIRKAIEILNGREQQVLDSAFALNTHNKSLNSVSTVGEPLILDIGTIRPPSASIGNAEVRFSLTNLTGKIVKVTSICLEVIKYEVSTAFISSTVAGPIDEYFLFAFVKPSVSNYELLIRHHELRKETEGFFLKIDAAEGYIYTFRLKATWHILGKEKNSSASPLFEIQFPVKSAEGLLRLVESLSQPSKNKENN